MSARFTNPMNALAFGSDLDLSENINGITGKEE